MAKFDVGDTVFHVGYGVGVVTEIQSGHTFPVHATCCGVPLSFTDDGRYHFDHAFPSLLTREEAVAKGYDMPKRIVKKTAHGFAVVFEGTTLCTTHSLLEASRTMFFTPGAYIVNLTGEYEVEE